MPARKTSIKPSPFPDPRPREIYALVLAAGVGKRMQSRTPKVLHPLAGKPMVRYVVDAALEAGIQKVVVVVGDQAESVREAVGTRDRRIGFCLQDRPLGTGHAVLSAEKSLKGLDGTLLILNGDLPCLLPSTLRAFLEFHFQAGAPLTLLTATLQDPGSYGRIVRNYNSEVARIVEATDASPEEMQIKEINAGIYCVRLSLLFKNLKKAKADNAQREVYLTELVEILKRDHQKVAAYCHSDADKYSDADVYPDTNNRFWIEV